MFAFVYFRCFGFSATVLLHARLICAHKILLTYLLTEIELVEFEPKGTVDSRIGFLGASSTAIDRVSSRWSITMIKAQRDWMRSNIKIDLFKVYHPAGHYVILEILFQANLLASIGKKKRKEIWLGSARRRDVTGGDLSRHDRTLWRNNCFIFL